VDHSSLGDNLQGKNLEIPKNCGKSVKDWGLSQGEHLVEYAHYETRER
jgi:hypothetical protein